MAPEQARGERATRAVDVYALGTILYEALTGQPPFDEDTPQATMQAVVHRPPVPPRQLQPRVPADLDTICLKCLDKDPGKRYASALDLADDLRAYLDCRPIRARRVGTAGRLWRWCRRHPAAAGLLLAVSLGPALGLAHLSRLSGELVRSTALRGAAQYAEVLDEIYDLYSTKVADRAQHAGLAVAADYATRDDAIPLPATLAIDLGKHITERSASGMRVRLYSDHPFRTRTDGGPHDDFERAALARLRENPDEPFYRFEDYKGRAALRYATALRMAAACVRCHNQHPDSTRTNWAVGDVRGVVEVIRPLDADIAETNRGLRGTFTLVAGASAALLGVSTLVLVVANRRQRPDAAAAPPAG
jgi:hypothetical protein